jgi:hypothetical protein
MAVFGAVLIVTLIAALLVDRRLARRDLPPETATRYRVLRRSVLTLIVFVGVFSALLVVLALLAYVFLRSGDLWLPIGLHFGWNFTLPLFGVNLSGLTMKLTGHDLEWSVGSLWSGGEYGPEGGVLTTIVMAVLALYVWKAPIRTQQSEVLQCAPGSLSSP